jgi:uncharacterized protein (DUF305 family)
MQHLLLITKRCPIAVLLASLLLASPAFAQQVQQHAHGHATAVVSTATPDASSFAQQMSAAMDTMNVGMEQAPMNGDPDHDFASMMVPHHMGAVDMAKAELLGGKNPVLRRLAQEIIVTQGSEISVMQSELNKMSPTSQPSGAQHAPNNSNRKETQ